MTFSRWLVLVAALCVGVLHSAEKADAGLEAGSEETQAGYKHFYAGELDQAAAKFEAASKQDGESLALFALAILANSQHEFQKGLELLCKAVVSGESSPWAELYVESITRVLPYVQDPKPFLQLAAHAAESRKMRPHIADLVRAAHAEWFVARGQFSAAAEAYKPLQFVTNWALIGPFDNRDGSGFPAAGEPEAGIDFEKSAPGRNRRVSWFQPGANPFDGRMDLAEIFEPKIHVAAYGASFVKAENAGWVVLRAGCAGALALWVNDKQVAKAGQYNDFGTDKVVALAYLHKGWNQILVKSAVVEETEWSFSLRLCRPEGGSVSGLVFDSTPAGLNAYNKEKAGRAAPEAQPPQTDLGLVHLLENRLKAKADDVLALAAYATLLDAYNLGQKEDRLAPRQMAKAIALAPKSPHLRYKMAYVSDDNNEARQAAEAAYATHPNVPASLEVLADLAQQAQLHVIAEDYARQALRKFGVQRAGYATLVLADVLSQRHSDAESGVQQGSGRPAEALRLIQGFVQHYPYLADGWHRAVELETSQTLRRQTLEKALSFCAGDGELRDHWAQDLVARAKEQEAAEYVAAGLQVEPFKISSVLAVSQQFRRAGNEAMAVKVLEDARRWAPENPELLSALGLARHYAGKQPEAVELFKEVLKLKPNSPQVKDYLAQLDKGKGIDRQFFAAYDVDLKTLPTPRAESYPDDNVVNILNQEVVRVNRNGSSSRMIRVVSKLLRPAGQQDLSQHYIYYEPNRQVVDILRASVITADGRELSRADVSDRSTSAAMGVSTLIYDEHHMKQVTFKDVEPGSIIDLQYTIRDTGENIYGDYFADTFYLSDDQPTLKSQYVLDYPKSLAVQTKVLNANTLAERVEGGDPNREIMKWEKNDSPGIKAERGMPPAAEMMAQLQVTTMKSWEEVGHWYWNLSKEQLVMNDQMKQDLAEIVKDCKTKTDKLRAIHDWTIKKIRYLGIEFGRNGYKPHKATETYKALYGDCKDTATLLSTLLPAVGIDCRLVLIRTTNSGAVPADSLPMPNLFNHCIAYVPDCDGKDYWIDGTTDFHRLGEVPYSDQGAQVLTVDAGGGKFVKIPEGRPEENLIDQKIVAKVNKDGSGTLAIHDTRHGQFAPWFREMAETAGQYERNIKDYAAKRFNGATVTSVKSAGAHEQGPMWTATELKLPALAAQSGERKALPATFDPLYLSRGFATENTRKHELEMWYCWSRKCEIVFEVDASMKFASLPEEADIAEPFGKYKRTVKQDGSRLTVTEHFEIRKQRIAVAEYEKFKLFCNKVDSLLDQKALLEVK